MMEAKPMVLAHCQPIGFVNFIFWPKMTKVLQQSHISECHSAYKGKLRVKSESSSSLSVCDFVNFNRDIGGA